MTQVSCQTTKWCSRIPFKHSAAVFLCANVQERVCLFNMHVKRACVFARPGVLFKLCTKAWLTSQHTSQSSPAMTLRRHRWDLDTACHRSENLHLTVCISVHFANITSAGTMFYISYQVLSLHMSCLRIIMTLHTYIKVKLNLCKNKTYEKEIRHKV